MRADANYYFLKAVRTYQPGAGSLEMRQWVGFRVWRNMLEGYRAGVRKRVRFHQINKEVKQIDEGWSGPPALSRDAEEVAMLVVENKPDLRMQLPSQYPRRSEYRRAVWAVLRGRGWQWSAKRIRKAFGELERAYS